MRQKVLITTPLFRKEGLELLAKEGLEISHNPTAGFLSERELLKILPNFDAVIAGSDKYTANVIYSAPKLRVIARFGVGYDSVDINAATKKGVYVTWTPIPEVRKSVAELAFTLMMAVVKRIRLLDASVRSGKWRSESALSQVDDIYGKTLGIIGLGRIGSEFAKRAKAFEMSVLYYDIVRNEAMEEEINIHYVSLQELLKRSDIISIHVALTDQTRGLIGPHEISQIKDGGVLINTSRGPVVDEKALVERLRSGKLGGAGLDVYTMEPPPKDDPLYSLDNVVLTPHVGVGKTTLLAMTKSCCEDVILVLKGDLPKHLLNREVLFEKRDDS